MKYKLIFFTLLFPLMAIAQSSNHNYIKETVYLDSMGTGITNMRYYNGLGYLTETASTCSGTSDNVYTYTTYDSKGRESTLYCPTPAGNTLDFQQLSAIKSASASFYRDNGAYTQNHYDHADRITREDMAGERWHSDKRICSTEDTSRLIRNSYASCRHQLHHGCMTAQSLRQNRWKNTRKR